MSTQGSRFNPRQLCSGLTVPNWLAARSEISAGAKLAYAWLLTQAKPNGICRPNSADGAEAMGMTRQMVVIMVKELIKVRLIELVPDTQHDFALVWHEWTATAVAPATAPVKKSRAKKPTAEGPNPHTVFIELWTERYRDVFNCEYVFSGGKDGAMLKKLLEGSKATPEELVQIAVKAWAKNSFACRCSRTISAFYSMFNRIRDELRLWDQGIDPDRSIHEQVLETKQVIHELKERYEHHGGTLPQHVVDLMVSSEKRLKYLKTHEQGNDGSTASPLTGG